MTHPAIAWEPLAHEVSDLTWVGETSSAEQQAVLQAWALSSLSPYDQVWVGRVPDELELGPDDWPIPYEAQVLGVVQRGMPVGRDDLIWFTLSAATADQAGSMVTRTLYDLGWSQPLVDRVLRRWSSWIGPRVPLGFVPPDESSPEYDVLTFGGVRQTFAHFEAGLPEEQWLAFWPAQDEQALRQAL